jgi:hypothetical protein
MFRKKMKEKDPPFRGLVLNINFPTCASGSVRGVRVVAVGRSSNVTAYTLISDVAGVQTWEATVVNGNFLLQDCTSTLASANRPPGVQQRLRRGDPLDAERNSTGHRLREIRFAERLF